MTCRICGAPATAAIDEARDYITGRTFTVDRCGVCGFGSTAPVPASMDPFYPTQYRRYSGLTLAALRRLYAWRVGSWARRFSTPGRAYEVGCGDGWMLGALRDRGWHVVGSERALPTAKAAATLNGVTTFVGDFDALRPAPRFRLIILFQVLEHLADPMLALRRGADLLEPGGMMLIAVPNFASWQARLFGRDWFHLDVPRHLNHFTPRSLARAADSVGLRVVSTRFASLEHDPYGWLQSALNRLGFPHNLLTRWLMGAARDANSATVALTLGAAAVLAMPSVVVAMCSWLAGAGSNMEVWAVKA